MKCNTTEKMINAYIKYYFSENISLNAPKEEQEYMKKEFKERTFQTIRKEIYELEKNRIKNDAKKEQDEQNKKEYIKKLNFFIIETLLIGITLGLLVNQITDFISYTKGVNTVNTTLTFRWIIGMAIILVLFIILVYNSHIREIFKNSKENENGSTV